MTINGSNHTDNYTDKAQIDQICADLYERSV